MEGGGGVLVCSIVRVKGWLGRWIGLVDLCLTLTNIGLAVLIL